MSIQYRKAVFSDLNEIYSVEKACFPGVYAYSKDLLRYFLERTDGWTIIALDSDRLIGFIMASADASKGIGHIDTVDILPSYKRRGIAKILVKKIEDKIKSIGIKKIWLEVRTTNTPAMTLYKNSGYTIEKLLKGYYYYPFLDSRDAYRMVKHI
jgi:ribosomal-protein-alanine N-acetyltransferase